MASLNIAIIVGSTRPGRSGASVAAWVHEQAGRRTDASYEVVDLDEIGLPLLDEAVPSLADIRNQVRFSLYADFPNRVFTPGAEHQKQATDLFDQLESWASALRTVRA